MVAVDKAWYVSQLVCGATNSVPSLIVCRIDLGNVAYAVNNMVDDKGRQILWSWLQVPLPLLHVWTSCIVQIWPPHASGQISLNSAHEN